MSSPIRVLFYVTPQVHLLDLSGPVQVFQEAAAAGADYELTFCADRSETTTSIGLVLNTPDHFSDVSLGAGDLLILPGMSGAYWLERGRRELPPGFIDWLQRTATSGAVICSVCTGAFLLGAAGLLNGQKCTTHWRFTDQLQERYPHAQVLRNRLFIREGNLYTSAGVTSGIDLALFMLEERHGPLFTTRIARELVVYLRRDPGCRQQSIYLDFRSHLHPAVHEVQDWVSRHFDQPFTIEELARRVHISGRHLTRIFKEMTGLTINEYTTQLRLEHARSLLHNPELTIEMVAARCGFRDPLQLRRLWKKHFGRTPSQVRGASR